MKLQNEMVISSIPRNNLEGVMCFLNMNLINYKFDGKSNPFSVLDSSVGFVPVSHINCEKDKVLGCKYKEKFTPSTNFWVRESNHM